MGFATPIAYPAARCSMPLGPLPMARIISFMGFLDMETISSFILLFFNFVFLCCWGQGYILVIEKIVCVWHIPFFLYELSFHTKWSKFQKISDFF